MENTLTTIEASLNDVVKSLKLIAQRADQSPRGRTEVRGYQMIELADIIQENLNLLDVEIFNTTAPVGIEASIVETEPTALEQSNLLIEKAESKAEPVELPKKKNKKLYHEYDTGVNPTDGKYKSRCKRFYSEKSFTVTDGKEPCPKCYKDELLKAG